MRNLFTLECEECGDVIFAVMAQHAKGAVVLANAEIFATCDSCSHTARYVYVEDGVPVWRGSE